MGKAIVTWDPKRAMAYECMSFLPDLTDAQIAKQVDYMIGNGWTPCVEFEDRDKAIAKIDTILGPGYYHNRYWNMWKLPLFGCTDGTQDISEIKECLQTYPDVTVRVIAFDRQRQVQVAGFIVRSKPARFGRHSGPFVLTGPCIRCFVLLAAPLGRACARSQRCGFRWHL